uniref:T-cell immunomodulatory protein n=1 Tax=Rhabditophanes sp. KR3021 TaxID=114890 RepID=A0AC35U107_9BILA
MKVLLLWSLIGSVLGGYQLGPITNLTNGGYHYSLTLSTDSRLLAFAAAGGPYQLNCPQIFRIDLKNPTLLPGKLSSGIGFNGTPFFIPNTKYQIAFKSNVHKTDVNSYLNRNTVDTCPPHICDTQQDAKAICTQYGKQNLISAFPDFDIFITNVYGNIVQQPTNNTYFSGEATFDGQATMMAFMSIEKGVAFINVYYTTTYKSFIHKSLGLVAWNFKFSKDGKRIYFFGNNDPLAMTLMSHNLFSTNFKTYLYYFDVVALTVVKVTNKALLNTDFNTLTDGNAILVSQGTLSHFDSKTNVLTPLTVNTKNFIRGVTIDEINDILFFIADTGTSLDIFQAAITVKQTQFEGLMRQAKTVVTNFFDKPEDIMIIDNAKPTPFVNNKTHFPAETHLANVKQLTFGGMNAEGYFSYDDNVMTMQSTGSGMYGTGCDQIYQIDLTIEPKDQILRKMSTGLGVCTCSYFFNDNQTTLYAGTFASISLDASIKDASCPTKRCSPDNPELKSDPNLKQLCDGSYTWDIYSEFDIFIVNKYGVFVKQLTNWAGYDAEGVLSPDGSKIAFTSLRSGDLDLWTMNVDGSDLRQITFDLGYDGGSFFSPDGKKLIFRASRPKTAVEVKKYKDLLSYNMVEPVAMELFVVNVDGTGLRQITNLGGANWAPYYLQDGKRVIFSTNAFSTGGFDGFDLWLIDDDGTGLEQVTHDPNNFNSFPMQSYNGKKLVWGSSRNGGDQTNPANIQMNLFLADWVDHPAPPPNTTPSTITKATGPSSSPATTLSPHTTTKGTGAKLLEILIIENQKPATMDSNKMQFVKNDIIRILDDRRETKFFNAYENELRKIQILNVFNEAILNMGGKEKADVYVDLLNQLNGVIERIAIGDQTIIFDVLEMIFATLPLQSFLAYFAIIDHAVCLLKKMSSRTGAESNFGDMVFFFAGLVTRCEGSMCPLIARHVCAKAKLVFLESGWEAKSQRFVYSRTCSAENIKDLEEFHKLLVQVKSHTMLDASDDGMADFYKSIGKLCEKIKAIAGILWHIEKTVINLDKDTTKDLMLVEGCLQDQSHNIWLRPVFVSRCSEMLFELEKIKLKLAGPIAWATAQSNINVIVGHLEKKFQKMIEKRGACFKDTQAIAKILAATKTPTSSAKRKRDCIEDLNRPMAKITCLNGGFANLPLSQQEPTPIPNSLESWAKRGRQIKIEDQDRLSDIMDRMDPLENSGSLPKFVDELEYTKTFQFLMHMGYPIATNATIMATYDHKDPLRKMNVFDKEGCVQKFGHIGLEGKTKIRDTHLDGKHKKAHSNVKPKKSNLYLDFLHRSILSTEGILSEDNAARANEVVGNLKDAYRKIEEAPPEFFQEKPLMFKK